MAEHVYKGTQRPSWEQSDLEALSDAEKSNVIAGILQHLSEDIATSMAHGSFYEHDDNHLSRTPMVVDDEGWDEVIELLDGALDGLFAIQEKVNEREAANGETKLVKVAILQFESPAPPSAA